MVKDLVCGMMVDQKSPPAKTTYFGKEYYFCSQLCKTEFENNPEKYIRKKEQQDHEKKS